MNEEKEKVEAALAVITEEPTITVQGALNQMWRVETPAYKQTLLRAALLARQRLDNRPKQTTAERNKKRKKLKLARKSRKRNR